MLHFTNSERTLGLNQTWFLIMSFATMGTQSS